MKWNASIFFKSGEVLEWSASVILRELSTAKGVSTYSPLQQLPAITYTKICFTWKKTQIPDKALVTISHSKQMYFEQNLSPVSCSSVVGNLDYSGGQKCWELSGDISKTSDPSPALPLQTKLIFEDDGWKWVLFWPQHCWGSGGTTGWSQSRSKNCH